MTAVGLRECPQGVRWCAMHDDGGPNDPSSYGFHWSSDMLIPLLEFRIEHPGVYNVAPVAAQMVQHADTEGRRFPVMLELSFFHDDNTALDAEGLRRFADWLREKAWMLEYIDEKGIEAYPGRW